MNYLGKELTLLILLIIFSASLKAQVYYIGAATGSSLYSFEISPEGNSCEFEFISSTYATVNYTTMTPESLLLGLITNNPIDLYNVDTGNGDVSVYYDIDPSQMPFNFGQIVCVGGGVFYGMQFSLTGMDDLWKLDTNDDTWTHVGNTGYKSFGNLTMYNGELYYYSRDLQSISGIVKIDLVEPGNSVMVVTVPNNLAIWALTPIPYCNSLLGVFLIGTTPSRKLSSINLSDGVITDICIPIDYSHSLTSMLQFSDLSGCDVSLDLDKDNSSGALEADYNSSNVNCLLPDAFVADDDVLMQYDDFIDVMTIQITGFVPDGMSEVIGITGSVPLIDVSGEGTSMLTLSNAGGAKSTDFIDALQLVRYMNTALNPTGGERTVEVQFTTASGSMSNVAIAYIQVNELPSLLVDLGPDLMICEGQTATFDAGSFTGGMYEWSSGETDQMITTSLDGEYAVTVSNGILCPDADTALIITIPIITVALTGDTEICDNEPATLTLNTNATFPITVEIQAFPGFPLIFDDVIGTYSFTDLPLANTTYTITSVTPSSDACIEVIDEDHSVDVFPSYNHLFDVSMCDGDSVWLGFYWETQAGSFEYGFNSMHGCDSNVTTNISIHPAVMIQVQDDTCDPAATGIFVTTIDNPTGCDTVVTTTVTLIPLDTTYLLATTCVSSQAGVSQNTITGSDGCDSLVITTTSYIPPSDTTYLYTETCDTSQIDVINHVSTGIDGCDSITITTITLMEPDTTYVLGTSCIPSQIGVFETEYTDTQGCDSLVISTITQGTADTTRLFTTSCDPASLGVFEELLLTSQGCDSLIITTVTFSAQDSTFITSATCDPGSAGEFVTSYINQFGCDSIVTETVTLNISHLINLTSSSCNPADTGVVVQQLTNQFGCDSIITETVSLLPSDQTFLSGTTCLSSEAGMFITTHLNQYGCDSTVTLTVSLVAADTTQFNFNTCDPAQTGNIETLFTGQDGCDSLVIQTTTLYPLPVLIVQSAIDYNGFDISCEGGADGSAIANINGAPPYTYLWSTNDTDQMITGLSAGDYNVAITDGNGCMTDGTVTLTEPDAFMIGFEVSEPDCFDQQLGSITVLPSGGVVPYTYSIDGTVFQSSPVFTGLDEGIYQIISFDANDCSTSEIISIDVPLMVNVELGTNQSISIGDSTLLEAIINLPFDSLSSVMWTGIDSIGCANCLTQIVAPIITTAYSVSVTSADGCADRDSMTVFVNTDYKIYIPNIFSPNGDGINDVVMVSAGEGVREITSFSIFDRWGNLVFAADHFQANDSSVSWDGRMKGEVMNPGVFTFRMVVDFEDGASEVIYGDITLIR